MLNSSLFSRNSDDWSTPSFIYDYFMGKGFFDPCPLFAEFDCLSTFVDKDMFINPPFSLSKEFISWAIQMHIYFGKTIVLLLPVRSDTKYFHKLIDYGIDLYFFKGRLRFSNSRLPAPFPCCLIRLNGFQSHLVFDWKF